MKLLELVTVKLGSYNNSRVEDFNRAAMQEVSTFSTILFTLVRKWNAKQEEQNKITCTGLLSKFQWNLFYLGSVVPITVDIL